MKEDILTIISDSSTAKLVITSMTFEVTTHDVISDVQAHLSIALKTSKLLNLDQQTKVTHV